MEGRGGLGERGKEGRKGNGERRGLREVGENNALVVGDRRYDKIEEFNVDWKAERGRLNLAHVTRNKTIKN